MHRVSTALLVLALLSAAWTCNGDLQPLELRNADLTQDADGDGLPDYWRARTAPAGAQVSWVPVEGQPLPGGPVVRAQVPAGVRTELYQVLEVEPGAGYTAGCWLQQQPDGQAVSRVYLRWLDEGGRDIGQSEVRELDSSAEGWAQRASAGYAPDAAARAALVVAIAAVDAVAIEVSAAYAGRGLEPVPLLTDGGFEADQNRDGQPDGWARAGDGQGRQAEQYTEGQAHGGKAVARLALGERAQGYVGLEQVSSPVVPPPALRLAFWYRGTGGLSTGMVCFLDGRDSSREYGRRYFKQKTLRRAWRQRVIELATPAQARAAQSIRLQVSLYQREPGEVWYDDVRLEPLATWTPMIEPPISALQTPVRPADGATVRQTPPDFSWTPQPEAASYDLQLARSPEFRESDTVTIEGLQYSCYAHHEVLPAGRWHWRFRYAVGKGEVSEWSQPRSFTVASDATQFTVPPADELLAGVPEGHPRVFFTGDSLGAMKQRVAAEQDVWLARLRAECEFLVGEGVQAEPGKGYDLGEHTGPVTPRMQARRDRLGQMVTGETSKLLRLALAYVLTDDEALGAEAVRRLLHLARWNPAGATSYRSHDQGCRELMWTMAAAYDWLHDLLSEQERQQTLRNVTLRAGVIYQDLSRREAAIHEWPYNSHGWTALGLLGVTAIALAHDEPEADEWLRFVLSVYTPLWPPWGGEDGGWSQGVHYWARSAPHALYYFDALKSATGLDMYQKAWARGNSWFAWYFHPPWCGRSHFGDGNSTAAGALQGLIMSRYAQAYEGRPAGSQGYLRWYADSLPAAGDEDTLFGLWPRTDVASRPPVDVPQGACLRDVGWVAMHQALYDANEIMLLFKSSPYGSYGHSHADQNSFVLNAFGEPLAIDSGYYDRYDSPHHRNWTRQTVAHNCVVVNGRGQAIGDETAAGGISRWFTSGAFDFATGDAAEAYGGRLKRFERSIVFVRPAYFVIFDDLEARAPAKYTWCLHALEPMELSRQEGTVTIRALGSARRGEARLAVRFALPEQIEMRQDDAFTEPPSPQRPNQWHAYIEPLSESEAQHFLVVLFPYQVGQGAPPEIAALDGEGCVGVRLSGPRGGVHLFRVAPSATDSTDPGTAGGLTFDGRAASAVGSGSEGRSWLLVEGRLLKADNRPVIEADRSVTAALKLTGSRLVCDIEGGGQVSLRAPSAPEVVRLDGADVTPGDFEYDAQGEMLRLTLSEGKHRIEAGTIDDLAAPEMPRVVLDLDGERSAVELSAAQAPDSTQVAWAELSVPPGPYLTSAHGLPEGAWVELGQMRLGEAEREYWLGPRSRVLVSGAEGKGIELRLTPVLEQREAINLVEAAASEAEEEEGVLRQSASEPVSTTPWDRPGDPRTWRFRVPARGRYHLLIKAATYLDEALRLIEVDGEPPRLRQVLYRFAGTGGAGARPEQWRDFALVDRRGRQVVLPLTTGIHTVTMTCLAGDLRVQYVALVPAAQAQDGQ